MATRKEMESSAMEKDVIESLKITEVALIAAIKFLLAPFEAERQGFNFKQAFWVTTAGGLAGIFAFTFVGEVIFFGWKKFVRAVKSLWSKNPNGKPQKKFTWSRKIIVKIKMKFGLAGLTLTTPVILSIPLGTFVTHRFYRKKLKNLFWLCVSLILWSFALNGIAQYLELSHLME